MRKTSYNMKKKFNKNIFKFSEYFWRFRSNPDVTATKLYSIKYLKEL